MVLSELESEVRGTQVRIFSGHAAGSGTVIYSQPDPSQPEGRKGYSTIILTCHHVIEDLIKVDKEWDPALGRDRKVEHRQTARIDFFDYSNVEFGKPPLTTGVPAQILAYDKTHDMAVLKAGMINQYPFVANMPTKTLARQIRVGDEIYACGCGLALDPVLTKGFLNHMGFEMDYKDYWGSSATITFGNSGGGAFWKTGGKYYFVGVPSRVMVQGWTDVANHIGFFSPVTRAYDFLTEQLLHFLTPESKHTEKQCMDEIKQRQQAEELRLKSLLPKDGEGGPEKMSD